MGVVQGKNKPDFRAVTGNGFQAARTADAFEAMTHVTQAIFGTTVSLRVTPRRRKMEAPAIIFDVNLIVRGVTQHHNPRAGGVRVFEDVGESFVHGEKQVMSSG